MEQSSHSCYWLHLCLFCCDMSNVCCDKSLYFMCLGLQNRSKAKYINPLQYGRVCKVCFLGQFLFRFFPLPDIHFVIVAKVCFISLQHFSLKGLCVIQELCCMLKASFPILGTEIQQAIDGIVKLLSIFLNYTCLHRCVTNKR